MALHRYIPMLITPDPQTYPSRCRGPTTRLMSSFLWIRLQYGWMCYIRYWKYGSWAKSLNFVASSDGLKTHQVQDLSLEKTQQGDALKFLMHFIGDLHQPLHVEANRRGGNDIHVCFDNRCPMKKNLHSVWDTDIPHKINGMKDKPKHNDEKEPAMKWAAKLLKSHGLRPLQAECFDTKRPLQCPMIWATETNRLNCDFVFKNGVEWLENNDLGGEYYDEAAPIVETQILKAGIRLAGWLNALATDRASSKEASSRGCFHGQYGEVRNDLRS